MCSASDRVWPCALQEAYGKLQEWTISSEAASRKLAARAAALQHAMQVRSVHNKQYVLHGPCTLGVAVSTQRLLVSRWAAGELSTPALNKHDEVQLQRVAQTRLPKPTDTPPHCQCCMQSITSEAQASAVAEDGRAAAGDTSRPGTAAGVPQPPAAAAGTEVLDQLAGLQQLVQAEAHKQQEVFDNTLKVGPLVAAPVILRRGAPNPRL